MFKIAICDDDERITKEIESLLSECGRKYGVKHEIAVFYDGKELEESMLQGERYTIIYLDIAMKQQNGLVTASNIRKLDEKTFLIYISAYEQYIEEIFEAIPFRFIKKPIDSQRFLDVYGLVYKKYQSTYMSINCNFKKEIKKIFLNDILYFESSGRYILIKYRNGTQENFTGKIENISMELEKRNAPFLRIHQSYLVNFNAIISRTRLEMYLENGQILPISRGRKKEIDDAYCVLMGGEIIG